LESKRWKEKSFRRFSLVSVSYPRYSLLILTDFPLRKQARLVFHTYLWYYALYGVFGLFESRDCVVGIQMRKKRKRVTLQVK